jgi:S-adenosylmethionine:tRNA ribosyltransferase-isomerase
VLLSDLQYDLPHELIAQHAVEPRDASRLLVLHRADGRIEHRTFRDIAEYLEPNDCLVLNNTRVIPARFFCRRASGGRIEGLFLHPDEDGWRVMLKPSGRLKDGEELQCVGADCILRIVARAERGEWLVRPEPTTEPLSLLAQIGRTPLPPYIKRDQPEPADAGRYQTVYAERPGAVAAPTAGLHFTPALLDELASRGVRRADVTLHVGPGTFVPIEVDDLSSHRMHAEWFEVGEQAAATLGETRASARRIVAVGTTATRVLESLPDRPQAAGGWTDIFIFPPYEFRLIDRLITNFHLPGSTLLALVMAFASRELILKAYHEAVSRRYRFYSYGDAMLII